MGKRGKSRNVLCSFTSARRNFLWLCDVGAIGVLKIAKQIAGPVMVGGGIAATGFTLAGVFAWLAVEFLLVGATALTPLAGVFAVLSSAACIGLTYVLVRETLTLLGFNDERQPATAGPVLLGAT